MRYFRLIHPEGEPTGGVNPPAPATPPHVDPPQPAIDANRYAGLERFYESAVPIMGPLSEDENAAAFVQRYLSDAEFRKMVDNAGTYYDRIQEPPKEDAPAWFTPYAKKIDDIDSGYRDTRKRADDDEKARQAASAKVIADQALLLKQEHDLDDDDIALIANYGDRHGAKDMNEAFRQYSGKYGTQKTSPPPPSLRQGAATPGTPGDSGNPKEPIKGRADLAARLARNIRAAAGNRS